MKRSLPRSERLKHPEKEERQPPVAGPHGKEELTDSDKTPGAGTLPPPGSTADGDSTAG
jgi:hypothetical protein